MARDVRYAAASPYLESRKKRCFDMVVCLVLLPPVMVLLGAVALVLLIGQGRPIFFVQTRVGRNGMLFRMPKFRTLRRDAPLRVPAPASDMATYATPAGRWLRRHKLDELPQWFTVVAGRMSLVGPRPELPDIVATYNAFQRKRLLTRPGVTGLWQVMANDKTPIHHHLKYDFYYLRKARLRLDVKLLALTIGLVLRPSGGHRS
jgi:lipopolysaccharide/colanic/teichoic acid biosynthesis glycosyltransferase